jgi:hypothetical protein
MGNAVFVANETGSTEIDGDHFSFHKGQTRVVEGHPLLKQCPELFSPAEDDVTYDIEQATKSPRGKRRGPKGKQEPKTETPEDSAATASPEAPEDLSERKRPELDALAAELGVEKAEELPNKAAVIEAIEAARQSE